MDNSLVSVVIVAVPVRLDKTYFYLLPQDAVTIKPGTIVNIAFGNKNYNAIALDMQQMQKAELAQLKLRVINKIYETICLSDELLKFAQFFAEYTLTPLGLVVTMLLRGFAEHVEMPSAEYITITEALESSLSLTDKRKRLLTIAARQKKWQKAQLASAAQVSNAMISNMVQAGFLQQIKETVQPPAPAIADNSNHLSNLQRSAAEQLLAAMAPGFAPIVLSGITGSGKTEVYFEAVARQLENAGQVLIILPEIALTQQFLERVKARFGVNPSVWHSGLNKKQRQIIWRQAVTGQVRILVGARSALFLPFKNLKLIIVDEEHDSSYKQEENIFYSARDMAVARAKFAAIPVILSSATPSIETIVNVNNGKYKLIELQQRYGAAQLPALTLIDMNRLKLPRNKFLSQHLMETVSDNLARGQQTILFLGRRGYAPITLCRACGYHFACPNCSAFLIEHKFHKALLCHHCGFSQAVAQICPQCNDSEHLAACGGGVERIAQEVQDLLPKAKIMILSTDLIGGIGVMRQQLEDISNGKVDIIIGTQLISKGHNFPKVSLVGVIDADLGWNNSDLRAAERSYQILVQVTGRAGRTGAASEGIIQTYSPQHPVIQAILNNDKQSFYEQEIAMRAQALMPPFARLAAIIISGVNNQATQDYARCLRQAAPNRANVSVLGPAQAPLAMIRNQYRYRILVKTDKKVHIQHFLRQWLDIAPKPPHAVKVQIDVDPQSFF